MFRRGSTVISICGLVFASIGLVLTDAHAQPANPSTTPVAGQNAHTALATLPIKGRAPKTNYARSEFGSTWADVDHNGCDTRNDILDRDLGEQVFKDGTKRCVLASGTLLDPYTATRIDFIRGVGTSTAVQIDHVVALSDAWQKGAQQLTAEERRNFANDPYNLLAVEGSANAQKGDGDIATWQPKNRHFLCEYAARQVGVKAKYNLWITQAEHDRFEEIFNTCPTQTIPIVDGVSSFEKQYLLQITGSETPTPTPQPTPTSSPLTSPTSTPSPKPSIATCTSSPTRKMYRLYNRISGEHLYTANMRERDVLSRGDWNYEGIGWVAPVSSNTPVYRLYNHGLGDHHYTSDSHEVHVLTSKYGWRYEGVGWYSDDCHSVPVYRQFAPALRTGSHNYTVDKREYDINNRANGWQGEGIAWHAVSSK